MSLIQKDKLVKSKFGPAEVYIIKCCESADEYAYELAVKCTQENFNFHPESKFLGKWGSITIRLKRDTSAPLFNWYVKEGKLNKDMLPICGEYYGPKGCMRWFSNELGDLWLSSDFNREIGKSMRNLMKKDKISQENFAKAKALLESISFENQTKEEAA